MVKGHYGWDMGADGLIYVVGPFSPKSGPKGSGVCVGAIVRDGVVVQVPPIVRDWEGWDARDLWRLQKRRAQRVEWVPD